MRKEKSMVYVIVAAIVAVVAFVIWKKKDTLKVKGFGGSSKDSGDNAQQ